MFSSILTLAILVQDKIVIEPAPPPRAVATAPIPMVVETTKEPEPRANRPVMPRNEPRYWIRSSDYPAAAREEQRTGETRVELKVSRWGTVAECKVLASSGHADLDAATCDLLGRRAQFFPAMDKDMNTVPSTWRHTYEWTDPQVYGAMPAMALAAPSPVMVTAFPSPPQLFFQRTEIQNNMDYPADALAAKAAGEVIVRLAVSPEGNVTGCDIAMTSGNASLDEASCAGASKYKAERPALDADGKPTRGVVERVVSWRLPPESTTVLWPADTPSKRRNPFPFDTSGKSTVSMVVGADGKVSDCTETSEGGMAEMGIFKGVCAEEARKVGRLGFKDGDGKPVAKRFSMTFAVDVGDVPEEADKEE